MLHNSAGKFLHKFLYVLQEKRTTLVFIVALFLFISFLEILGVGLVGPFIAIATDPSSMTRQPWLNAVYKSLNLTAEIQLVWILGILVISIFYIKSFLAFKSQKHIFEFGLNHQGVLSSKLMRAYLAAPYTFHLSKNSAVLIQNILGETGQFANGLLMPLLTSISNFVVSCALIFLLINTSSLATLTVASTLLIIFLIYYRNKERLAYLGKEASDSQTEVIRIINHSLGGLKETKLIGCENYFESALNDNVKKYAKSLSFSLGLSILPRYILEAFLVTFLILFTFAFLITKQENTQELSAVLGVFAMASIRLLPAMSNLLSSVNGIKFHSHILDKLYFDLKELETLDISSKQRAKNYSVSLPASYEKLSIQEKIVLDCVTYGYPDTEKTALDRVSLEIGKGKSIGLIGKSGAGKTTLVDVILGLLTPQSGDIRVDDRSIYADLRSWQNLIGYVPQSIFLIDDTLECNIAFGQPDDLIDKARLYKAIEAAQLSELVEQLPNGIKTVLGERGILLSGGQRQRVGIARALYYEREILVFDEATAALDNETEQLVTESIKSLSGTKTMIIIAHRLSTIKHCDRIYLMEKGRVVKSGTYREVVLGEPIVQ